MAYLPHHLKDPCMDLNTFLEAVPLAWDEWLACALLALFLILVIIQLAYHWYFFARIAFYRHPQREGDHRAFTGPVSVVVCARDEYHKLKKNLPVLLQQDYPQYEVIVVDDASGDDTDQLLRDLEKQYEHLKVISLKSSVSFLRGKKFPLSVGIRSARHERLLLTDADCRPSSSGWLRLMSSGLTKDKEIVLGFSPYEKRPGLLNALIRFDTLQVAMQYLSFALAGRPYMGVGRNLAYKKELFYRVKGFVSHYDVISGDDDLFINQVATRENTAVELSPAALCVSAPKTSFAEWFRQKRRHLSTGKRYKKRHKRLLGLYQLSLLLFYPLWLGIILWLGFSMAGLIATAAFILRLASAQLIYSKTAAKLHENKNYVFSLIGEPMLVLIYLVTGVSLLMHETTAWK